MRPIFTLMLFTAFVPELITGNTPPRAFVNPVVLFVVIVGYGIPILLIRELVVRYSLNLRGVVLLGLAYGLLNEGFLAKTIVSQTALPILPYSNYGFLFGVSLPWAAFICLWHAIASVAVPIALIDHAFPEMGMKPWLSRKVAVVLTFVVMALGVHLFLHIPSAKGVKGSPQTLVLILGAMTSLAIAALFCTRKATPRSQPPSRGRATLLGASLVCPLILLAAMAQHKVALEVFFIVLVILVAFYAWSLRRLGATVSPGFLYFGLGAYLQTAIVSVGVQAAHPPQALIAAVIDVGILLLVWRFVRTPQEIPTTELVSG